MIKLRRRAPGRGEPGPFAKRPRLRAGEAPGAAAAADLGTRELDPQILAQLRELQDWAVRSRTTAAAPELRAAAETRPAPATAAAPPTSLSAAEAPQTVTAYRDATPGFDALRAAAAALQDEAPEPEAPEREPRPVDTATSGPPAALQPRSPDRAGRADRGPERDASSESPSRRLARREMALPSRRPAGEQARRPTRWSAALAVLLLVTGLAGYRHRAASWQAAPVRAAAPTGEMPGATSSPAEIQPHAAVLRATAPLPLPAGPADTTGLPESGGLAAPGPSQPLPYEPVLYTPPGKAPARRLSSPSAPARTAQLTESPAFPSSFSASGRSSASSPTSPALPTSPPSKAKPVDHLAASVPAGRHAGLLHAGPGVRPPALLVLPAVKVSGIVRRHRTGWRLHVANLFHTDRVQLDVLVNDAGHVARAEVHRGDASQAGLERAALKAAMAARFRAATRYGVPGSMWTRLSFDFKD